MARGYSSDHWKDFATEKVLGYPREFRKDCCCQKEPSKASTRVVC